MRWLFCILSIIIDVTFNLAFQKSRFLESSVVVTSIIISLVGSSPDPTFCPNTYRWDVLPYFVYTVSGSMTHTPFIIIHSFFWSNKNITDQEFSVSQDIIIIPCTLYSLHTMHVYDNISQRNIAWWINFHPLPLSLRALTIIIDFFHWIQWASTAANHQPWWRRNL